MIKFLRSFALVKLILKLEEKEPNDFSFGSKVRRALRLYRGDKKINEEEIFKENSKL
jgi:hypothetical protein